MYFLTGQSRHVEVSGYRSLWQPASAALLRRKRRVPEDLARVRQVPASVSQHGQANVQGTD